jgi:hypothetical protein
LSSLTLCFPIGFHFLAYPNLFGIKGFVVVVVVVLFIFICLSKIFLPNSCQQQLERKLPTIVSVAAYVQVVVIVRDVTMTLKSLHIMYLFFAIALLYDLSKPQ